MIKGKTKSGFSYEITDAALNNFELLDVMAEVDNNPLLVPKMLKLLLGEKGKKVLYDHVRNDDGTVPTEKIKEEILEIFKSESNAKNF